MKRTLLAALLLIPATAHADLPEVVSVQATNQGDIWTFNVTLRHADEGWDHYADGWRVLDANGVELGYRLLAHPHVNEQPFTRGLSGVQIPEGLTHVIIRPHDLVHGDGPDFVLKLP